MISPAYVRTMAAYNSEMNRRLYTAASRIPDNARRAERGAFWGSLHGTLAHLVWADQYWMSRFDGWERPPARITASAGMIEDFDTLSAERRRIDDGIEAWAIRVDEAWIAQDLLWDSMAARRQIRQQRGFLVTHFFNHQTHHRGQAHALLTACGGATGDTDLVLVVEAPQ
ncbi:MAG: DUF664 domain-containing protein [Rhodospirillales bacterium]|jgi:uncharacterized damage-inducible protein DinB|nr:DUF664 domain-containing protein [Rhodospirillales bacterium]